MATMPAVQVIRWGVLVTASGLGLFVPFVMGVPWPWPIYMALAFGSIAAVSVHWGLRIARRGALDEPRRQGLPAPHDALDAGHLYQAWIRQDRAAWEGRWRQAYPEGPAVDMPGLTREAGRARVAMWTARAVGLLSMAIVLFVAVSLPESQLPLGAVVIASPLCLSWANRCVHHATRSLWVQVRAGWGSMPVAG